MTQPVPRNQGPPIFQWLLLGSVVAAGLGLGLLSQLPGPSPAPSYLRMIAVHRALAPRMPAELPVGRSALHTSTISEGEPADAWVHRTAGGPATVHRVNDAPRPPRNAQDVQAPGGPVTVFDVDDLSLLCWGSQPAFCVIGVQPVADLKVVVERVRATGPGEASGAP